MTVAPYQPVNVGDTRVLSKGGCAVLARLVCDANSNSAQYERVGVGG